MFYPLSSSVRHDPLPRVSRRQVACGEGCQIIEFRLQRGAVIPLHDHPNEQVGMVVSGRLVITVGGEERELVAGDGYSIGPGVRHGAQAAEDTVVIDVFSPPRADYKDR